MVDKKKKVLIIKLGAIGDVVHTTIIATAIKQSHPDWEVHYLTLEGMTGLLNEHPHIDKLIVWDRAKRKSFRYFVKIALTLFQEHYDIVFNLTNAIRNVMFSILACPRKIAGKKTYGGLWIEDYFQVAKNLIPELVLPNRLYLGVNELARTEVQDFLKDYPRPYFVISPAGVSDKFRQGRIWDIMKWKKLTELIKNEFGGTVFVCGAKDERDLHELLHAENTVICSGEFSLAKSNALFSCADIMISGDSGPLHVASAHNVNTLALLGSTSPVQIRPYGENGHYISGDFDCKFCWEKKCKLMKDGEKYTPCMESISPESVVERIKNILNKN